MLGIWEPPVIRIYLFLWKWPSWESCVAIVLKPQYGTCRDAGYQYQYPAARTLAHVKQDWRL